MNRLDGKVRIEMLDALCHGASMRGLSRSTGASINTATKLIVDVGRCSLAVHDVCTTGLNAQRLFCIKSGSRLVSEGVCDRKGPSYDLWTWSAHDAATGAVAAYQVGGLDRSTADNFIRDLGARLTSAPLPPAEADVAAAFSSDEPFELIVPSSPNAPVRIAYPDDAHAPQNYISRILERRSTRLRNAYSRSPANFLYVVSIAAVWQTYIKLDRQGVTRAMACGLTDRPWTFANLLALTDYLSAISTHKPLKAPRGISAEKLQLIAATYENLLRIQRLDKVH